MKVVFQIVRRGGDVMFTVATKQAALRCRNYCSRELIGKPFTIKTLRIAEEWDKK